MLLKDDNPDVRCVAVEVASKIFAIYYEIIPSEILIATINIISNDLAFDSTSPEVRRSVIQGLRYMVQNCPLSHPLLKSTFPLNRAPFPNLSHRASNPNRQTDS